MTRAEIKTAIMTSAEHAVRAEAGRVRTALSKQPRMALRWEAARLEALATMRELLTKLDETH